MKKMQRNGERNFLAALFGAVLCAGAFAMPETSLREALDWLDSNAAEGGHYTITLNANETMGKR
jgi:hypothetical protein